MLLWSTGRDSPWAREIDMTTQGLFPHERLDAYNVAVAVARDVRKLPLPTGHVWLRDQMVRSSSSVVLNIAEATGRSGAARRNHFRIALGSMAETAAALDLLDDPPSDLKERCRRVGAMLHRLSQR